MSKTKILFFVDSHGSKFAHKKIKSKARNVDLIVCAGDFTFFEEDIEKILTDFDKLNKPFLIIPGNHEFGEHIKQLCAKFKNIIFVDKDFYEFHNIILYFDSEGGFSLKDSLLEKQVKKIKNKFKIFKKQHKNSIPIIVFHAPPFGTTLDDLHGTYVGSKSKTKLVSKVKPNIVIAGHIHETKYRREIKNNILYLNPGPNGRILDL